MNENGDWFIADFDAPCSGGCVGIVKGETARADGNGGLECWTCSGSDAPGKVAK